MGRKMLKLGRISGFAWSNVGPHIDVEARVGVPKSTIAETGMGVTSRPFRTRPNEF